MAYSISRWNGRLIATVADGTIDTSLDIKLVGKSYAGYGQAQNENFVYLLENFANTVSPPNPLSGQIWYDSANAKLKFYDGSKFRVAGGAEVSSVAPTGLSTGDFWFDTVSNQLFSWNGATFTLIGPQAVSGAGTTQMQSTSVRDASGGTHAIIQAIDNGSVIFTISADADFVLDNTANAITGFTTIRQGVTLCYTNNNATPGVTTSSHRFYGTATNADKLGGLSASNYIQAGNAAFSTVVNFSDVGFTVGNPINKLSIFNDGATTPTIQATVNSVPIVFQTRLSDSSTATPLKLSGNDVMPGVTLTSNLGSNAIKWNNLYANYVYSTAQQADALTITGLPGVYATANTANVSSTVVARDAAGAINVTRMNGIAQNADALKLGSAYVATSTTSVASTVVARDASANIAVNIMTGTATQANTLLAGGSFLSAATANTASTIVYRDASGNFSAGTISAALTGNTTGVHKGNVNASDNSTLLDATTKTFYGTVSGTLNGASTNSNYLQVDNSQYRAATTASTANTVMARDGSQNVYANIFNGTASAANYADLAEKYLPDAEYSTGTVVSVGGEKEITAARDGDRAIGVISANPAFMMNKDLEGGVYVALKGRVPVFVVGPVSKGAYLISSDTGCARASDDTSTPGIFAVSLETSDHEGLRLIECVIL